MERALVVSTAALLTAFAVLAARADARAAYELNIGSLAPEGTSWRAMLEKFERNVETGSNGQIEVILRPVGQMGEVDMVRETRRGERLQGCAVTTASIAEGASIPEMQLVELPYLFESNEEADYVLDEVLWTPMTEVLATHGFVLGMWSENGWRSFATKGRPVRTPDDLKGFTMRAQESEVHLRMYETFGAQALQKPATEVITALESNVVDGLDSTAVYLAAAGIAPAVDYFTLTRHIYQPGAVILSKRWFDSLPPDLQKVVLDQKSLAPETRTAIRAEDKEVLQVIADEDVEIIELTAAERAKFAVVARAMNRPFAESIGATSLYDTIDQALVAWRAAHADAPK
jgi:TRAP-type C4-dicarboxylate transport system substrate-binding protein